MRPFAPKMKISRRKSQIIPIRSPSTDEFCFKITRLASRHEQMKIAYQDLKSQINAGLLEAEEVFASLAIPLMKLVGLKTKEMAEEGRFSTFTIDNDFFLGGRNIGRESKSSDATKGGEQEYQIFAMEEGENYATRATMAGKELIEKQHINLVQLVQLLRQIENQVNYHQDDILAALGKHRLSLHKFFQKAIQWISAHKNQNYDIFYVTMRLFQASVSNVETVLGSVECGVENLIRELAENMCNPMVEYVNGLKDDMNNGISVRLFAMVREMERMMRNGKLELEDARKKVRVAEEEKIKALCKLKTIEERMRSMKQPLSLPKAQRKPVDCKEPSTSHKFLGMEEERAKDDKLLWKLLKKKRKYQGSPIGPEGLLWNATNNKHCVRPSSENRPVTSWTRALGPQSPCSIIRVPSSPSLAIQPVGSHK